MALFKKKPKEGELPVQDILRMRDQGMSDVELISDLQGKGFSYQQINDALAQADVQRPASAVAELPAEEGFQQGGEIPLPPGGPNGPGQNMEPMQFRQQQFAPSRGAPQSFGPPLSQPAPGTADERLAEKIEEIAESIIDEKWDELLNEVKKVVTWKEKMEAKLVEMENEVKRLNESFKELHQGVLGKVEEYDERMREVGTELKAVGQVFKDVVPTMTESVKELEDITRKMKKGK